MFRLIFISILFFSVSLQIEAQTGAPTVTFPRTTISRYVVPVERISESNEMIRVERIGYLTERIGMTAEEAQLFWPIYNEMDNRRNALFEERAAIMQKFMTDGNNLTERQIDEQLRQLVSIQQQEMALPAEYDAKFRGVLSARKVMNLYVAEMGFRNYLLQRMQVIRREPGR